MTHSAVCVYLVGLGDGLFPPSPPQQRGGTFPHDGDNGQSHGDEEQQRPRVRALDELPRQDGTTSKGVKSGEATVRHSSPTKLLQRMRMDVTEGTRTSVAWSTKPLKNPVGLVRVRNTTAPFPAFRSTRATLRSRAVVAPAHSASPLVASFVPPVWAARLAARFSSVAGAWWGRYLSRR